MDVESIVYKLDIQICFAQIYLLDDFILMDILPCMYCKFANCWLGWTDEIVILSLLGMKIIHLCAIGNSVHVVWWLVLTGVHEWKWIGNATT